MDREADILLAVLLGGMIGLMVIPLPASVIDVVLSADLALGLWLVLVSMTGASFPANMPPRFILTTELFHLAFCVCVTRHVLSEASAGAFVEGIGALAATGGLAYGAGELLS